jgi:D-serine deaminase-like pyridoxal phosphate-dependent protein
MNQYEMYKKAINGKTAPLAWVDLDKLDQNIQTNLQRAKSRSIRVATKSVRCVHILKYILNASEQINGLMCYHPQEAAYLAEEGFDDLLIAYPSLCQDSITAALKTTLENKTVYFMVDRIEHVEMLNTLSKRLSTVANVCIDLDMSVRFPGLHFGVHRSNIKSADEAIRFYKQLTRFKHIKLCGLMGYEAQIAGLGDNLPNKYWQNKVVRYLKKRSLPIIEERRTTTILALMKLDADITLINGGGTGSIESTIEEPLITEVTVGSGFYCSHLFDYYTHFQLQPAAGFAVTVSRKPTDQVITCNGGGYVASGNSKKIKMPIPHLPEGLELDGNEGTGEVQTPLHIKNCQQPLSLGDPVFFRHAKAGELCEHFNSLHLLRKDKVVDEVPTYRGNGWMFM